MMENEQEFDVERVMQQLNQIIIIFNSKFGSDYSVNNSNHEEFAWTEENNSNAVSRSDVPKPSQELVTDQNSACHARYNKTNCDTFQARFCLNGEPDENFPNVDEHNDSKSDSGNDEPAGNLFQPGAVNSSNNDEDKSVDSTQNLNVMSFGGQRNNINLEDLPPEVLSQILKYLDDISLWCFGQVKPYFENTVLMHFDSNMWKKFIRLRWPLLHIENIEGNWYKLYSSLMRSVCCVKCMREIVAKESPTGEENSSRNNQLKSEQRFLRLDPPLDGIDAMPLNLMSCHWLATIQGPRGTPYEGGLFFLSIQIPYSYPMSPPTVKFLTKILHPDISRHGDVRIDSINHNWTRPLTPRRILLSVQSLLTDLFCNMERDIAKKNKINFENRARKWTWKYAMMDLLPF